MRAALFECEEKNAREQFYRVDKFIGLTFEFWVLKSKKKKNHFLLKKIVFKEEGIHQTNKEVEYILLYPC